MSIDQSKIRNFCIIAHIDHGKSTLADRIIEMTGLLTSREMQAQVLDNMDLERERGITIKSQAVRIIYHAKDGEEYIFNLIDTPGHVDFTYEVSRSLAACDGAVLVVDAAQGIEAQTLANVYLALDHDLEVIPVINKIDLPSARPEEVVEEIEDVIGIEAQDAPRISAKTGLNVEEVLEQIVHKLPAPKGDAKAPLQALIFDSVYDAYKGVIVFCRIREGSVKPGTTIRMMATGAEADGVVVDVNSLVSMNMWGLTSDFLNVLEEGFKEFFEKEVPGNPLKAEYLIPIFIGELLEQGKMSVKVLKTDDTWYGMTYHEDVAAVRDSFKKMLADGVYKADLFADL